MFIGDVELPIVSEITPSTEADVDEIKSLGRFGFTIDSVPVKHENAVMELTISGFVNSETHNQHLSIEEQKRELKKLRRRSKMDNSIHYKQYKGYLLIEEVNFVDDGSNRIVNAVEIVARYLPWPKYYSGDEP